MTLEEALVKLEKEIQNKDILRSVYRAYSFGLRTKAPIPEKFRKLKVKATTYQDRINEETDILYAFSVQYDQREVFKGKRMDGYAKSESVLVEYREKTYEIEIYKPGNWIELLSEYGENRRIKLVEIKENEEKSAIDAKNKRKATLKQRFPTLEI